MVFNKSPQSKGELEDSLTELVQRAHCNGVSVAGGYELSHIKKSIPNWDVTIVRLK